jgi:hypothetical protein
MSEKLRKLAATAPPGPWIVGVDRVWSRALPEGSDEICRVSREGSGAALSFIAACDPITIHSLLDERDALRARSERYSDRCTSLAREIDTLRARAEKAEAQARLGWERAAEKDRAYGDMIAQRDAALRERDEGEARIAELELHLGGMRKNRNYWRDTAEGRSAGMAAMQARVDTALRERDEARAERDARPAITPEMAAVMILWTDGIDIDPGSATKRVLNDAYAALRAHAERAGKGG